MGDQPTQSKSEIVKSLRDTQRRIARIQGKIDETIVGSRDVLSGSIEILAKADHVLRNHRNGTTNDVQPPTQTWLRNGTFSPWIAK